MDRSNYPTFPPKREFHETFNYPDSTATQETSANKRRRCSYNESFLHPRSPLYISSDVNSPCSRPGTPAVNSEVLREDAGGSACENSGRLQVQDPLIEIHDSNSFAGHGHGNVFEDLNLNDTSTPISLNEDLEDYNGDIVMQQENVGPEICFGMIKNSTIITERADYLRQLCAPQVVNRKRGKLKARAATEITINSLKSFATVHLSSGDEGYIGLLDNTSAMGISQILEIPSVRLQAFLPSPQPSPDSFMEEEEDPGTKELQNSIFVYINIYGASSVGDDVGKILSANGIYLQYPINNEKKPKYKNPHYFDENELFTATQVTASRPRLRNVEEKVRTIFDININDKLPEIQMGDDLQTSLLSHQKQAVYFMLLKEKASLFGEEDVFASSIWMPIEDNLGAVSYVNSITKESTCTKPQTASGGILADDMGLGKSLTTLALITRSLGQAQKFSRSTNRQYCPTLNRVQEHTRATLIIGPLSLLDSWKEQIVTHIKPGAVNFYIYHGAQKDISVKKLVDFDIVLTTYATIRAEMFSKKVNRYRRSPLKEIKWFRIVLDEAHTIREHSTQQSRAVCMLEAEHRWCLSGTPIQNKLQDFGTLLRFLRLSPFDKEGTFVRYIVRPLKAADPDGLKRLRILIGSTCLRRNKDILELPPKLDQEIDIYLEPPERRLYEGCKKDSANLIEHALSESANGSSYFTILQSILRLRLMCDHGKDLLPTAVQNRLEGYSCADPNPSTGLDIDMEDCVVTESPNQSNGIFAQECALCNKPTDAAEAEAISSSQACSHTICDSCLRLYELNITQLSTLSQNSCPKCAELAGFSLEIIDEDNPRWMEDRRYCGPSTKVKALIKNLQDAAAKDNGGKPIKSVVFSCWTKMLDLIAIALKNEEMKFCRYDGRLSIRQRDESIRRFRGDPQINILLISIGSGAVGLNLTVASRVHLMEPQWNPMVEHQALDRLHRIGQQNEVITTRYIVKNTIEENILSFQKRKLAIASISMCQTQKPLTSNEHLKELQTLLR